MRALAGAVVGMLVAGAAAAQTSLIDPDRAWQRRQADTVERRAVTDPAGAAAQAREARRLQGVENRGAIDPDAITTEQRLERAQAGGKAAGPVPPRPARAAGPLPFSADTSRDRELFEAERDPLATADILLERAAEGIAEGRTDAARSDLSLVAAELQMAGDSADPRRLDRARRRLGELEARLPGPR